MATNSISQNKSRGPSLDWIVTTNGVVTSAVSSQPWSGEANVHVSVVNWVKSPDGRVNPMLNGAPVCGITSALRTGSARPDPVQLPSNQGICFQGPIPAAMGFIIDESEANSLRSDPSAPYTDVVRRYLMGDDIASDPRQEPSRWIIDFGYRSLEEAFRYELALDIVRQRVRPQRLKNRDRGFRERWWQFGRPRGEMRSAIGSFSRYIGANRVGKRLLFVWVDAAWCPGDKVVAFAFDGWFHFGVLLSRTHCAWAWMLSSTLKADLNYTPTSAFETFPWPQPSEEQHSAIGDLAKRLVERRSEICLERQIGLTKLYNEVDEGAYRDLKELHVALDEAVAAAYGWPASVAHDPDESNRRLLELNRAIAAGEVEYRPFD